MSSSRLRNPVAATAAAALLASAAAAACGRTPEARETEPAPPPVRADATPSVDATMPTMPTMPTISTEDQRALDEAISATSEDVHVARSAAGALGSRKDEGGRAALEALLDDETPGVRYTTVLSIIDLGATKSRAALQARKQVEKDPDVRGALRKALGS